MRAVAPKRLGNTALVKDLECVLEVMRISFLIVFHHHPIALVAISASCCYPSLCGPFPPHALVWWFNLTWLASFCLFGWVFWVSIGQKLWIVLGTWDFFWYHLHKGFKWAEAIPEGYVKALWTTDWSERIVTITASLCETVHPEHGNPMVLNKPAILALYLFTILYFTDYMCVRYYLWRSSKGHRKDHGKGLG